MPRSFPSSVSLRVAAIGLAGAAVLVATGCSSSNPPTVSTDASASSGTATSTPGTSTAPGTTAKTTGGTSAPGTGSTSTSHPEASVSTTAPTVSVVTTPKVTVPDSASITLPTVTTAPPTTAASTGTVNGHVDQVGIDTPHEVRVTPTGGAPVMYPFDASGNFSIQLAPGTYDFGYVYNPHDVCQATGIVVAAGATVTVNLTCGYTGF